MRVGKDKDDGDPRRTFLPCELASEGGELRSDEAQAVSPKDVSAETTPRRL